MGCDKERARGQLNIDCNIAIGTGSSEGRPVALRMWAESDGSGILQ